MKYRKLRIAWSVAWSVACLLLVAFWVRSHLYWDYANGSTRSNTEFSINSIAGRVVVFSSNYSTNARWSVESHYGPRLIEEKVASPDANTSITLIGAGLSPKFLVNRRMSLAGFTIADSTRFRIYMLPYWAVTLLFAAIAAVPWLPMRFSLRALLICMTVAAVGLGWIVFALRS